LPFSWVGLSVTMPGKEEALALAEQVTERAELTGAANTLVRSPRGWWADNTDVDGITRALAAAGCRQAESAWVVGSGATARSVLVAVHGLGVRHVILHVRSTARSATLALAETLGITVAVRRYEQGWPRWGDFEVAVSTAPAGGAPSPPPGRRVVTREGPGVWAVDVAYQQQGEWARGLSARGAVVVPGSEMLLYQAAQQVQAMTGQVAPLEAMRSALASSGGPARR
jgi:shikimate dehydrogenase